MTTVGKLFDELVNELEELYTQQEAINIMRLIFQEKLGLEKLDLAIQKSKEIDEKNKNLVFQIAEKLMEGQPVQQILGNVHFLDLKLRVNKNVLIPRPETEELCQLVINENKQREELQVLDVGTGSGCIAIALAKHLPESQVSAIDISQPAIELARINAIANAVSVDFINQDILNEDAWKKLRYYDIIVSNPPYVLPSEMENMHINVVKHEPHIALFVPQDDPLIFYKKIADIGLKHLLKKGVLYFEINEAFGPEVKSMLKTKGYQNIKVRKDLRNKDRFVSAEL